MLKIAFSICLALFVQASVLTEAKNNEYKSKPTEPAIFDDLDHWYNYHVSNSDLVANSAAWSYTLSGSVVLAKVESVDLQKDGSAIVKIEVEENLAKDIAPKHVTLIWPKSLIHHGPNSRKLSEFPPKQSKMILNFFLNNSKQNADISQFTDHCRIAGTEGNLLVARKIMAESKKEWEELEGNKSQTPSAPKCAQDPICESLARACKFTDIGSLGFCPAVITIGASCSHLISCETIDKKCVLVKKNKADACIRCNDNCLLKIKDRFQTTEMASFATCFEACAKSEDFKPYP